LAKQKPTPSLQARAHKEVLDISSFTPDLIRNFCIISHIDHGKTTLSNALLGHAGRYEHHKALTQPIAGTLDTKQKENELYLDKLQVEKERGITVKAHTATLFHTHNGVHYMLNLIDTPVDP